MMTLDRSPRWWGRTRSVTVYRGRERVGAAYHLDPEMYGPRAWSAVRGPSALGIVYGLKGAVRLIAGR